jgi:hypothetical protein
MDAEDEERSWYRDNRLTSDDDDDGSGPTPNTVLPRPLVLASATARLPTPDQVLDQTVSHAIAQMTRVVHELPWDNFYTNLLPPVFPPAVELLKLTKSSSNLSAVWTSPTVPVQITLQKASGSLLTSAIRRLHSTPWPVQQAASREKALRRWRMIVEENYSSTALGINLRKLVTEVADDFMLSMEISDTFADRKASTLNKRSGMVLRYLIWHRQSYGFAGLPLVEERCYRFIKTQLTKAPTSGKSFLSSIRFCLHVLQMKGCQEVLNSGRIKGATFSLFVTKKPLRQRRPFLVIEVLALESIAVSSDCPYSRYFCFFLLLQTYARARFNDIARERFVIVDLLEDGSGYLEISVKDAKTQRSAEARTTFLPTVSPAVGVSQFRWAVAFLKERTAQGLDEFCLMPTPAVQGGWHDSPLEINSANKWLKDILASAGFTNLDLIGTHTCKVTGLSWLAKYNADLQTRALLGYHLLKEFGSTLTYSRDAMSGPLRVFDKLLSDIRSKSFAPDVTRSGRVTATPAKKQRSAPLPKPVQEFDDGYEIPLIADTDEFLDQILPEIDEAELSSNSDDSSSDSDSGPEVDMKAVEILSKRRPAIPDDVVGKIAYYHNSSCILHFRRQEQNKLKCGRALTSTYTKVSWENVAGLINCHKCFS